MSRRLPDPTLTDRVIDCLSAQHPGAMIEIGPHCDQLAREQALLDEMLRMPSSASKLRIWDNRKCIVVSRRIVQRPGFSAARAWAVAEGWPVIERRSGGTAVIHRAGILNISLFLADSRPAPRLDHTYGKLITILQGALARLGLNTDTGAVPGSFCDGAHNLRWRNRKLAGTAALVRRRAGITATLVHASLLVEGELADDIEAIRGLEQRCGLQADYIPHAHVSVSEALHHL